MLAVHRTAAAAARALVPVLYFHSAALLHTIAPSAQKGKPQNRNRQPCWLHLPPKQRK